METCFVIRDYGYYCTTTVPLPVCCYPKLAILAREVHIKGGFFKKHALLIQRAKTEVIT